MATLVYPSATTSMDACKQAHKHSSNYDDDYYDWDYNYDTTTTEKRATTTTTTTHTHDESQYKTLVWQLLQVHHT